MVRINQGMTEEKTWICPKCKLLRSNRMTHKHGEALPAWKLAEITRREAERLASGGGSGEGDK